MENNKSKHRNIVRNSIIISAILIVIFSASIIIFYFLIDNKPQEDTNYYTDHTGNVEDINNNIINNKEESKEEDIENKEKNKKEKTEDEKENKENNKEDNKKEENKKEENKEKSQEKQRSSKDDDLLNIKLEDLNEWNKTCDPHLIIVNRDNEIPERYNSISNNMQKEVVNQLEKMIQDAKKDSVSIWVSSRFRDIALQTRLYNREVSKHSKNGYNLDDAKKVASFYVARPRTSEHNMGVAVDFNGVLDSFYKTKEYKWLIEHGPKYGFILRYPKSKESITGVSYEPWHFRYVGAEDAIKISESGKCLEEYINNK